MSGSYIRVFSYLFYLLQTQVCRRNFSDICRTVRDISTSGLDGHIAISGYPSVSRLFVDTFLEFYVVDNIVYRTRITVILTSDSFGCMSLWLWLCSRWRPITTAGFVHHLENVHNTVVYTPTSPTYHFQSVTFQKYHICALAWWTYNAGSRKISHVDVRIKPAT